MNEKSSAPSTAKKALKKALSLLGLLLAATAISFGGGALGMTTKLLEKLFPALVDNDAWVTGEEYLEFWGIWAIGLLALALIPKNRPILGALGNKVRGNTWKYLALGLATGFGMNALCAAAAMINGDIHIYYDSFRPVSFVLLFAAVFIQSSAEEFVARCFLYQRLRRSFRSPLVAIFVNALFFGAMHLGNPGVSALAITDIVITGLLFSLVVYYLDSFWCAAAIHAAWNFTQNILLGLPNSGNVVPYSVMKLDAGSAVSSFAYDPAFGLEGTVLSCAVQMAVAVAILLWGRRRCARPTEIWAAQAEKM